MNLLTAINETYAVSKALFYDKLRETWHLNNKIWYKPWTKAGGQDF